MLTPAPRQLKEVQQVEVSCNAVAARLLDGSVVTWGHEDYHGIHHEGLLTLGSLVFGFVFCLILFSAVVVFLMFRCFSSHGFLALWLSGRVARRCLLLVRLGSGWLDHYIIYIYIFIYLFIYLFVYLFIQDMTK